MDFLFGDEPSQTITPQTTLTPEQEELLRLIIGNITGGFGGDGGFGLEQSQLELSSLAGLEGLVNNPFGGEPGAKATSDAGISALGDIFKTGPADIDEFFTQTVQNPLLEDFSETILPQLQSQFSSQFFGGERREAEGRARGDLIDTLGRERTRVGFEARQSDIGNTLAGLGVLPQTLSSGFAAPTAQANLLLGLLGAGGNQRQVQQQQLNERSRRMSEALGALGIPGFENIVFNNPGSTGFIPGLANAALGGFTQGLGQRRSSSLIQLLLLNLSLIPTST